MRITNQMTRSSPLPRGQDTLTRHPRLQDTVLHTTQQCADRTAPRAWDRGSARRICGLSARSPQSTLLEIKTRGRAAEILCHSLR